MTGLFPASFCGAGYPLPAVLPTTRGWRRSNLPASKSAGIL